MPHHVLLLHVAAYFIREAILNNNIWELVEGIHYIILHHKSKLMPRPCEGCADIETSPFGGG